MKLYDLELSGNCYKVRLFAALANIELEIVPVDFMAGEHKSSVMLSLNPFDQLGNQFRCRHRPFFEKF